MNASQSKIIATVGTGRTETAPIEWKRYGVDMNQLAAIERSQHGDLRVTGYISIQPRKHLTDFRHHSD